MSELVERARVYATQAHQRIHHQRKYSKQPYQVHLDAVARLVASVTDDPEMLAAAWLHDTVEDTPATLDDIEAEFGTPVAELVEELTDVSRPGDGNRVVRKQIDRRHTAQASGRAKTVKLADLIDCLQLSDKGQILIADSAMLARLGFDSRSTAKRVVKELESLRNNLAHAQDIVTHDWAQIARMTQRIEGILRG